MAASGTHLAQPFSADPAACRRLVPFPTHTRSCSTVHTSLSWPPLPLVAQLICASTGAADDGFWLVCVLHHALQLDPCSSCDAAAASSRMVDPHARAIGIIQPPWPAHEPLVSVLRACMSPEGVTVDRESLHVFLVCVELASGTLGLLPGYGVRPKLRPDCSAEAVLRATPRLSYAKRTRLLNTVDST